MAEWAGYAMFKIGVVDYIPRCSGIMQSFGLGLRSACHVAKLLSTLRMRPLVS
jgi:hypothetical protein